MDMQIKRLPMEALSELLMLQLASDGTARLSVTGYSMMPMLRDRKDSVALRKAEGLLKKGDIIFYRRENGSFVLHRIIRLKDGGYICCGDNQAETEPVSQEQVFAVVTGYFRQEKQRSLKNPAYLLYKALWVGLFPLRKYYIRIRRRLGKWRRDRKAERS